MKLLIDWVREKLREWRRFSISRYGLSRVDMKIVFVIKVVALAVCTTFSLGKISIFHYGYF
jgi:hypothetical protein